MLAGNAVVGDDDGAVQAAADEQNTWGKRIVPDRIGSTSD
jgi:hypothetical protein